MLFRYLLSFVLAATLFCQARPVLSADAGRYSDWQAPQDQLRKMIDELDGLISEGARSRAAHPVFLDDLNSVLNRYRIPKRTVLFFDDFADYDFSRNPLWTVSKGQFQVDRFGSLYSAVASRRPAPAVANEPEQKEESESDRNFKLFFGVLQELAGDRKKEPEPAAPQAVDQAVIVSQAVFPNHFNLQYSFRSEANWGAVSIGLFQGNNLESGYHLVYRPSPGGRPLQLIKYLRGKAYVVDEAAGVSPDLDDGLDHKIRFSRSLTGEMVIIVDDKEIIRTSDLSYQQDFSGLAIINNGGSYGFDNIEIFLEK